VRVITEDGELIRELVLDPARDYQPTRPDVMWNDDARHVGTMSRDITMVPPAGIEPATPGLGNRCSIH
jgi:hypothetical protein